MWSFQLRINVCVPHLNSGIVIKLHITKYNGHLHIMTKQSGPQDKGHT